MQDTRELINSLNDETLSRLSQTARDLEVEPVREGVSTEQVVEVIRTIRNAIRNSDSEGLFSKLPVQVKELLEEKLSALSHDVRQIVDGDSSDIDTLVATALDAEAVIWQYNLYGVPSEIFKYSTSVNTIAKIRGELEKLKNDLQSAIPMKDEISEVLENGNKAIEELENTKTQASDNATKVETLLKQVQTNKTDSDTVLTGIHDVKTSADSVLEECEADKKEVSSLREDVEEFFGQIENYTTKMAEIEKQSQETITNNQSNTESIQATLTELEGQIKEQLEKATGYSLFHSFQKRKEALVIKKRWWGGFLGIAIAATIAWSFWLAYTTGEFSSAFYLKLSVSLPLAYMIGFCSVQYARERKLEEEYAFKSNISLSFKPYRDLVGELVNRANQDERKEYNEFIVRTIDRVFTSPVKSVFDDETESKLPSSKQLSLLQKIFNLIPKQ